MEGRVAQVYRPPKMRGGGGGRGREGEEGCTAPKWLGLDAAVHVQVPVGVFEGREGKKAAGTHLKSIISTSFMRRTMRISCFAPLIREPMMVSFRSRLRPSSGAGSSRKL